MQLGGGVSPRPSGKRNEPQSGGTSYDTDTVGTTRDHHPVRFHAEQSCKRLWRFFLIRRGILAGTFHLALVRVELLLNRRLRL